MLEQNIELENAWILKEQFVDILHSENKSDISNLMIWLHTAEYVNIPEFKNCIKTLTRWRYYIYENFLVSYTNAYTEGKHNLIKTLKRNAFGYRSFYNIRKRILLCT